MGMQTHKEAMGCKLECL